MSAKNRQQRRHDTWKRVLSTKSRVVGNSINQGHIPHLNYTSLQRRGRPKGKDTHEIRMKSMKPVKRIILGARNGGGHKQTAHFDLDSKHIKWEYVCAMKRAKIWGWKCARRAFTNLQGAENRLAPPTLLTSRSYPDTSDQVCKCELLIMKLGNVNFYHLGVRSSDKYNQKLRISRKL